MRAPGERPIGAKVPVTSRPGPLQADRGVIERHGEAAHAALGAARALVQAQTARVGVWRVEARLVPAQGALELPDLRVQRDRLLRGAAQGVELGDLGPDLGDAGLLIGHYWYSHYVSPAYDVVIHFPSARWAGY